MYKKNQRGIGLIGLVIGLIVVGFAAVYGVQVALYYLDKNFIQKSVKVVLMENKNNDTATVKKITDEIFKRISLNNVELDPNDVKVSKDNSGYEVQIDYSKEIGINHNMKFIINFSIDESTP